MNTPLRADGDRLWSLRNLMITFDAKLYFQVVRIMTTWARAPKGANEPVAPEDKGPNAKHAKGYIAELGRMGFPASIATLRKIVDEFEKDGCKWGDVHKYAEECLGR